MQNAEKAVELSSFFILRSAFISWRAGGPPATRFLFSTTI